ncbi:ATP-binding protein [Desulfatitalea alkaliphila]|uniref:histidine kinase n=1 Tax=Desulfatitalea alkaliphila TaxID=2929485 RepID=A0AA41R3X9_9BACT|nr:ATP-binding protein [Desulfatitalea alkaliphila]MCJ8502802.1 ATP-binding protein [Desulfatitalea alkaliphila]
MRIAIVGCGDRCVRLMELIAQHDFQEIDPRIIMVADLDQQAPGMVLAREKGIATTTEYGNLLQREDIDLIIELTAREEVFNDLLQRKRPEVRIISAQTIRLFWELSYLSDLHKQTRRELQDTRAKCKLILDELIQEEVMIINRDYRIADINRHLLNKLGLRREEAIGHHCYEITHHRDTPCSGENHPCPLVQTLETGKPSQTTHVHLDKENRELIYAISTYPIIENHTVTGAIEIARDITREINMQKTLMEQDKLASIGRLSAGVAHEINNPLTTILTSTMLLQEDLAEEDPAREELQTIANETLRCRKIVTSLLDFARQNKPQKSMANVNGIVTETILLTHKQAAFKDITVSSQLAPRLPDQMVDKGQLEQALINLILNAVESTPEGGAISITTAFQPSIKAVQIDVADTGKGIPQEDLDKIFEPFFTTRETGTGLGLAITHGIIQQHGGSIEVESKRGHGTRFSIYLPLNQNNDPA